MSSKDRYIINIYKIVTNEDKLKVFIGSTKEKLSSLLIFYKKNCFIKSKNKLYDWIRPLNKSNIKIKSVKTYAVNNFHEQKERELYWIKKYKNYGYTVISNEIKLEKVEKKEKLYVCIENTSISEITKKFGDRVVSISKENSSKESAKQVPVSPSPQRYVKPEVKKTPINQPPTNYIDELKNMIQKQRTTNKSLLEMTNNKKKKKINFIPEEKNTYKNFVEELRHKFRQT